MIIESTLLLFESNSLIKKKKSNFRYLVTRCIDDTFNTLDLECLRVDFFILNLVANKFKKKMLNHLGDISLQV